LIIVISAFDNEGLGVVIGVVVTIGVDLPWGRYQYRMLVAEIIAIGMESFKV